MNPLPGSGLLPFEMRPFPAIHARSAAQRSLADRSEGMLAALALVFTVLLSVAGCGPAARPDADSAVAALPVRTLRAMADSGTGSLVLPGRARADQEVTLTARVPARLTSLAREGAHFDRFAPLARFDSPEARGGLAASRAAMTAAAVRRERARSQEVRLRSLFASGVVSKGDLEQVEVERQAAESAWSTARAQVTQWQEGTTVTASFDGFVVRRFADPGAVLQPGDPVLSVRSSVVGEIVAAVPESRLGSLAGGRVEYRVGDGAWRPARLVRVEGMTDVATRTRAATFSPLDGVDELEAGAFVHVRIELREGAATRDSFAVARLRVPSASLVRRGGLAGVFVIADGRARLRWLRLGDVENGWVEVLAGLWPGDEFAADPAGLTHGRMVRVEP
jgi:RND family efflux transporter MFP subunit